jgi:hypothetical protein
VRKADGVRGKSSEDARLKVYNYAEGAGGLGVLNGKLIKKTLHDLRVRRQVVKQLIAKVSAELKAGPSTEYSPSPTTWTPCLRFPLLQLGERHKSHLGLVGVVLLARYEHVQQLDGISLCCT